MPCSCAPYSPSFSFTLKQTKWFTDWVADILQNFGIKIKFLRWGINILIKRSSICTYSSIRKEPAVSSNLVLRFLLLGPKLINQDGSSSEVTGLLCIGFVWFRRIYATLNDSTHCVGELMPCKMLPFHHDNNGIITVSHYFM